MRAEVVKITLVIEKTGDAQRSAATRLVEELYRVAADRGAVVRVREVYEVDSPANSLDRVAENE